MPVLSKLENDVQNHNVPKEIDSSPTPFTFENILILMKENAGADELYTLRQLSSQYRKAMNSTYFDLVEKCAVIDVSDEEPTHYLSKVSKDVAHIYRRLEIRIVGFLDKKTDAYKEVKDFLQMIGPNITEVDIISPQGIELESWLPMLQELLSSSSFPNMTTLKLRFGRLGCDINEIIGMRYVFLQFPSTTHIKIYTHLVRPDQLLRVAQEFSNLDNLSFHDAALILGVGGDITSFQHMATNTQKWFKDSGSTFKKARLWDEDTRMLANNGDVNNMMYWLDRVLGLTKCTIFFFFQNKLRHYDWDLSSIPNESCWKQNIKELQLYCYSGSLLGLRDFSNLEKLLLDSVHLERCLLSDVTISDEDNVKTIFEGLNNLEVKFVCINTEYKTKLPRSIEPYLRQYVRKVEIIDPFRFNAG